MTFLGQLHPYQQEAFDRIVDRRLFLLAAEMGLGKTPISLAAMERLMDDGVVTEPGLIFTLASLKYQWKSSVERFTNSKALVIDGPRDKRMAQYDTARNWVNSGVDYIILNYETLLADYEQIMSLPRGFLVLDESTAIKGLTSKRHKLMKRLSADVPVRVGLTGTPMTNGKPEEIYAQLLCIDPTVLGHYQRFDSTYIERNIFGGVDHYKNLPDLHRRLSTVMLSKRQTDPDVAKYLPKTIYKEPVLVELDAPGKKLYRKIVADLMDTFDEASSLFGEGFSIGPSFSLSSHYGVASDEGGPGDELQGRLASQVGALRMLCSHPHLLHESADAFDRMLGSGSKYVYQLREGGHLKSVTKSPKLRAVSSFVSEFLDQDPTFKVVIFSTFVATLPLLQESLSRFGSVTYSGRMNAVEKEAARVKFQTDPDTRIFISSDAGGFGVDLPQANMLVNYDLPWSSGAARQRNGRVQRASSQWEHVVVQNFLIDKSMELRQWDMLQQKTRVEDAVLGGVGVDKRGELRMTVGSLRAYIQEMNL